LYDINFDKFISGLNFYFYVVSHINLYKAIILVDFDLNSSEVNLKIVSGLDDTNLEGSVDDNLLISSNIYFNKLVWGLDDHFLLLKNSLIVGVNMII